MLVQPGPDVWHGVSVAGQVPEPLTHLTEGHGAVVIGHVEDVASVVSQRPVLVQRLVLVLGLQHLHVLLRVRVQVQQVLGQRLRGLEVGRVDERAGRRVLLWTGGVLVTGTE